MERLSTFDVADPSRDALERTYAPIIAAVEQADSPEDLLTAVSRWDEQRCVNGTWRSLVGQRAALFRAHISRVLSETHADERAPRAVYTTLLIPAGDGGEQVLG